MPTKTMLLPLLLVPLLWVPASMATMIPCASDMDCHDMLPASSECLEGFCSNPFHNGGCLQNFYPEWHRKRVCNSHDSAEAIAKGYCTSPSFDYTEIRILASNWASSIMVSWVLQILLGEILGVPASIETGFPDLDDNFYDLTSRIDLGGASPTMVDDTLLKGNDKVDCRSVSKDAENYEACANVAMEAWVQTAGPGLEQPRNLGVQGQEHWFIPKFTAERDPTLTSYFGMVGESNRHKLAETFKRPTPWGEYCDEVSVNGCATNDGVASRAPVDDIERTSYFVQGEFIGHFRATEENDCDAFPDTCTGHFVDYPCGWGWLSFMKQQAYHLDIALSSSGNRTNDGYDASHMIQIWEAAQATKSDVIMLWWTPETTYEQFQGTDAEMTQVLLPSVTQECLDARVDLYEVCGDNETSKYGDAAGACDWPIQNLKKLIAASLKGSSRSDNPAFSNPAYETISNFEMTNIQYSSIFQRWFEAGVDGWEYDLRAATCSWVVDNLDVLQSFVPETYPRVVAEVDTTGNSWYIAADVTCGVSIALVLVCAAATFWYRNSKIMHRVQVEFMSLLLLGLVLVSIASVIAIVQQTNATCTAVPWFESIGNTIIAVTLGVRVYAISKLNAAGKQMRHVRLRRKKLYLLVGALVCCAVALLTIWTVVGDPKLTAEFTLSNDETVYNERIVHTEYMCATKSDLYELINVGWNTIILLPVLVVSITLGAVHNVNDTKALRITLLARAVMSVLRCIAAIEFQDKMLSDYLAFLSVLLGVDSILTMILYIIPKFFKNEEVISDSLLPDMFLNTTVAVASIDGFTAWSSVREPVQVFQLLEVLFESFDEVAERHNIFKAETSANFFVMASGVPDYRHDHAMVMARFATDCMKRMSYLTRKLETRFGPDTADLGLRIGMDSGAITGGYTFGKKDSFQLFGDTMTTARLLHESGQSGRILASESTADLIIKGGRKNWVQKLENKIVSDQKGELQAFWLSRHHNHNNGHVTEGCSSNGSETDYDYDDLDCNSESRWIEWNTDILRRLLVNVIAGRQMSRVNMTSSSFMEDCSVKTADMPLEEVKEIIQLPHFDKEAVRRFKERSGSLELPEEVVLQLHDFVTQIASMYRKNPFHNFAHASYVVMAVTKYLNRINAAKELDVGFDADRQRSCTHAAMHDHTYGITSDPLTHFACVFSALIHDVDHPGVPNPQLIKENDRLAAIYKERSVAEQRSFDLSWDLFMDPSFNLLRKALCPSDSELTRFRQLVINSVMATDLGDKLLKDLRNNRWTVAFDKDTKDANTKKGTDRKATIVIEHLIQAADVAHTCQHWTIYRKWNERFFRECYEAYQAGRAEKNPADYWYQGELGFFDFYIIPLSKKLRDCGVFGSTSDENLNYALSNRAIWEKDGKAIVAGMLESAREVLETAERFAGPGSSATRSTSKTQEDSAALDAV